MQGMQGNVQYILFIEFIYCNIVNMKIISINPLPVLWEYMYSSQCPNV